MIGAEIRYSSILFFFLSKRQKKEKKNGIREGGSIGS